MDRKAVSGIMLRLFLIVILSAAFCSVAAEAELKTVKFSSDDAEILSASSSSNSWVWIRDTITGAWGEAVVGTGDALYVARKSSFYRYRPADDSWTVLAAPPNPDAADAFKTGTALAWDLGNYIYALYGAATADSRRWFYRYSISGNSWQALANTSYDQGEGDAITWAGLDNRIYATVGGEQRPTYFLRYDPSMDTWSDAEVADPPAGMGDGTSLVWAGGELLYALRGEFYEESPTHDFWHYNITSDIWTAMADIPAYPHDGGVGGVGDGGSLLYIGLWLSNKTDFLYALSGNQAYPESPSPIPDNRFYRYTISTDSWERLADLPFGIGYYVGCRLAYAGGRIHAWQGTPSTWAGGGDDLARYKFTPAPRTWTVDDDGPADFSKIQDAINAASPGDTIYVYNGTYCENVVLNKTLHLIGENNATTIVDGLGLYTNIVLITAQEVRIEAFTIRNHNVNGGSSIKVQSNNAIINNNIITNTHVTDITQGIGVWSESTENITIVGNMISKNYYGIKPGFNSTIRGNVISNNSRGMMIVSSGHNIIYENVISENMWGIDVRWENENLIYHNNFVDNYYQVYAYDSTNTWDYGYPSGGNYWSDYTGVDLFKGPFQNETGSDGIGDIIYVINENNRDRYPLMNTWTPSADKTPPVTTISLSGVPGHNDWFTSDVTVTLSAIDDSEVDEIKYSFDNVTWTTYTTPFTITNEGNTTIYYKSTDKVGNPETIKTKTIKIDKTVPSGSITINDDATYATSTSVTLTLTTADATSGVYQVRFSNDGLWDTEPWESSSSTKTWALTSGDGAKIVYFQIKDYAGLISETYSDDIILDTAPPTGSITIDDGATYANSSSVALTLIADDATSGVAQMRLSHDNATWTPWETYSTSKAWTLTTGDGTKTVYIQYVDNAGLVSQSYFDTITLDATPPAVVITSPSPGYEIKSSTITVTWTGSDATSGISHYEIRLDEYSWIDVGTNTTHTFTGLDDGSHTIEVKAFDNAALTKQDSVNFIVNTSPLLGPGYTEEAAILATTIIAAVGIALYFFKIRKR